MIPDTGVIVAPRFTTSASSLPMSERTAGPMREDNCQSAQEGDEFNLQRSRVAGRLHSVPQIDIIAC